MYPFNPVKGKLLGLFVLFELLMILLLSLETLFGQLLNIIKIIAIQLMIYYLKKYFL